MAIARYGVLRAAAVASRAGSSQSPHYQVLVRAGGKYRIAVNVASQTRPSAVLYYLDPDFQHPMLKPLLQLKQGFRSLASKPGTGALDFVRGNLFDVSAMKPLPMEAPPPRNDLNRLLGETVARAIKKKRDCSLFAFGQAWGPEHERDQVFGFKPGQGIHDIHMNQGNVGKWRADDGVYQDGGLLFHFESEDKWVALFLAFQSQSFYTDDADGHGLAEAAVRRERVRVRIANAVLQPFNGESARRVTLANPSPKLVSLKGWTLVDKAKHKQPLGGLTLEPGATASVMLSKEVAADEHGALALRDRRGNQVHGISYGTRDAKRRGWVPVFEGNGEPLSHPPNHRRQPREQPLERPLRVYAFDPSGGRNLGNYMTVRLPYEKLAPGPIGPRVAVVDYDASNRCYYEPVDLDEPAILVNGGLEPRESDPRFHQQMVYAVVTDTLRHFEQALGRKVHWNRNPQLRVYPHAMHEANAFYSQELKSLLFGYFPASKTDPGKNNPGQAVFTCLSHDIVAHETTHAVVDGIRSHFMEPTNPDVAAFHEALADVVALFRHFSYRDALLDTIQKTGGDLFRAYLAAPRASGPEGATIQAELGSANPLVGLAQQFGDAMGMRRSLRSALGVPPNTAELERVSEPHARGSILVAAIFDAFFTAYVRRTDDLFRIFRAGGAGAATRDVPLELARQLADEASKTAGHFFNMCVRALDYCPPVDITFGDFLRALITADIDIVPDDDLDYRDGLMQAFRARGIRAMDASFFSEDALRWNTPEVPLRLELDFNPLRWRENQETYFHKVGQWVKDAKTAEALHLDPTKKTEVASMHLLHRAGPDGDQRADIVAEFIQHEKAELDPADSGAGCFELTGGTTAIFEQHGGMRYAIYKHANEARRLRQQHYLARMTGTDGYGGGSLAHVGKPIAAQPLCPRLNLAAIHRGY